MICFTDDELWQIEQEYMRQYETWQDEEVLEEDTDSED